MTAMDNKPVLPVRSPEETKKILTPTPKAIVALILCTVSITASIFVLYSYLSFFHSAAQSHLADIGLVQFGVLFVMLFPSALAILLAFIGFGLVGNKGDANKEIKVISIFSIWLSFAYFALHTISLWGYAAIAVIVSTILYMAKSPKFKSRNQKILTIIIVVIVEALVAIGVNVLLRTIAVSDPVLKLIFFV
ncbi:MAG: hypothetical protein V4611_02755 [Patescibacteria group bacterium]